MFLHSIKKRGLIPDKTYATYENAERAAHKAIGCNERIRFIIAATAHGRFFPVAIGTEGCDEGIHFRMAIAA